MSYTDKPFGTMTGSVEVKVPTAMAEVLSLLSSQVVGAMPGMVSENSANGKSLEIVVVVGGSVVDDVGGGTEVIVGSDVVVVVGATAEVKDGLPLLSSCHWGRSGACSQQARSDHQSRQDPPHSCRLATLRISGDYVSVQGEGLSDLLADRRRSGARFFA